MRTLLLALVLGPPALLVVVVCLRHPLRWGLPLYAVTVPFGDLVKVGGTPFGSPSSLLGVLVAMGLVARLVAGHRAAPRIAPPLPVWVLFLGLATATSLWTIDRPTTLLGLAVLGPLIVIYVLASLADVDRSDVRRLQDGIVIGGVSAVGWGLFQLVALGGFQSDTPGAGYVAGGRFGNGMLGPNIEAVTLLLPLAIAAHRATSATSRHRVGWAALGLLMLAGIQFTGSRTGTLGVAVVIAALAWTSGRAARRGLLVALVVGAVLTGLVWVYHPLGIANRTFSSATSSSGRIDIWEVGLEACRRYCFSGSGWGTFPDVYAQTQALVPGARVLTGPQGSYQPHNLWLLTVIETGLLGMVLFTVGLLLSLWEAVRLPLEFRGPATAGLLALACGVVFLSSMEFKIFWLVLLLVDLYGNLVRREAGEPEVARTADAEAAGTLGLAPP